MTDMPAAAPEPARLSKAALFSLVCGVLGCIPFVAGGVAIVLGLIGFVSAGKPGMKGRWMAIVGALLGVVSIFVWILGSGAALAWVLSKAHSGDTPAVVGHDFIKDLTAGDTAGAKSLGPTFDDAGIKELVDYCESQGTFTNTSFNTNIDNEIAHLDGTAKFSKDERHVTLDLKQVNGQWQVTQIDFAAAH